METTKPKATALEFAKREELEDKIDLLSIDSKEYEMLNDEYIDLMNSYDFYADFYEENGMYGIKLTTGKVLVPAMYHYVDFFPQWVNEQSYVPVCLDNKWGIVRADGSNTIVHELEYDYIAPIQGPLAIVKKGDKWGYLDIRGELSTPVHFDSIMIDGVYSFVNGISIFQKDGLYGVTDGVEFSKPVFDEINAIEIDDYVTGSFNGTQGYINIDGEFTEDQEEAYWMALV